MDPKLFQRMKRRVSSIGNGNKKALLWRKSLNDTVKKLMTSKDSNTLSASHLRNPAYKNHILDYLLEINCTII